MRRKGRAKSTSTRETNTKMPSPKNKAIGTASTPGDELDNEGEYFCYYSPTSSASSDEHEEFTYSGSDLDDGSSSDTSLSSDSSAEAILEDEGGSQEQSSEYDLLSSDTDVPRSQKGKRKNMQRMHWYRGRLVNNKRHRCVCGQFGPLQGPSGKGLQALGAAGQPGRLTNWKKGRRPPNLRRKEESKIEKPARKEYCMTKRAEEGTTEHEEHGAAAEEQQAENASGGNLSVVDEKALATLQANNCEKSEILTAFPLDEPTTITASRQASPRFAERLEVEVFEPSLQDSTEETLCAKRMTDVRLIPDANAWCGILHGTKFLPEILTETEKALRREQWLCRQAL